jgi:hypothetical protein
MKGSDDVTYLHVPSGFHFAVYPDAPNQVWRMCAPEALPLPFDDSHMKLTGRAVVFAHYNSIALARGRRGRDGSFIVDFADPDYFRLVMQDAPPLPRVAGFAHAIV